MRQQHTDTASTSKAGSDMNTRHHPLYSVYRFAIVALGLGAILFSGYRIFQQTMGLQWLVLASLALLTGSFTIRIPGINSKISVAETFIITNLLLFGPAIGCITAALDGLLGSLRCKTAARRRQCLLFNTAVMALSAFAGGEVFYAMIGRSQPYGTAMTAIDQMLLPLAALALVYYLVNTLAVAAMVGLDSRQNIYSIWRRNFLWLSANYVTAAVTAGLLVLNARSITPAVLVTVLAIIVSSYVICTNYTGRFATSPQH